MAEPLPSTRPAGSRRWRALSGIGGSTLLALAVIIVAIAAADRSRLMLDLSADHRFTVDPVLRQTLAEQRDAVQLVGIWPSGYDQQVQPVVEALQRMVAINRRITWQHIDPDLHRPALQDFTSRHGGVSANGLYVARGDRVYLIPLTARTLQTLQREIGAALISLADPNPPVALLMQGHGELRPGGGPVDGADELAHHLTLGGFIVHLVDGTAAHPIPPSALLVVAGPISAAFSPEAVAQVDQHLLDGGSLLALVDDRAPTDLCRMLRLRGVVVGSGFPAALAKAIPDQASLLDPSAPTMPGTVLYSFHHNREGASHDFPYPNLELSVLADAPPMINPRHPITAGVASTGIPVVSPRTSEVDVFDAAWALSTIPTAGTTWAHLPRAPSSADKLLSTLPGDVWSQSYGRALVQPEGLDQSEPRALAWSIEYPAAPDSVQQGVGGRMVIWGSRQAASNALVAQGSLANADLLRSMASWLVHRQPPSAIPDTQSLAYRAELSDKGLQLLCGLLVVLAPLLLVGVAMLTWWDRR